MRKLTYSPKYKLGNTNYLVAQKPLSCSIITLRPDRQIMYDTSAGSLHNRLIRVNSEKD